MSPNNKEEEYVDLYSDLFNDDEVHHSAKCATSTTTNNNNNNNNNKSSLDDEVLFFGHLGSLETETLTTENEQLKATLATKERTIAVLRNNISSLYKTAKLELERRSAELAEVRREYDTLIFRRRTSQAAAGVGLGMLDVQAPVPPPPPPVESPVIMIGTEQSTARSADRHSSHNSPLGSSSSSSRYSPYSTPRHSENASSNRKEAVRPATEPIHRAQSRYSSSSSSRHSSSTPIRHHHSHHHHHHQHRNRLFD
ncbi:hypothetical protein TYRP_004068 [Tyrophagus putrescentiae]|nr:hypothetical protein TYRP_004068 [Tyrophagus putrescentiae]